jgi:hypothetical protein
VLLTLTRRTLPSDTAEQHDAIDPRLSPPHLCCTDRRRLNDYDAYFDDPRVVRQCASREAIATSSGQSDSGMFELNFRDERYLPFEYLGAASRWRIELSPEEQRLGRGDFNGRTSRDRLVQTFAS